MALNTAQQYYLASLEHIHFIINVVLKLILVDSTNWHPSWQPLTLRGYEILVQVYSDDPRADRLLSYLRAVAASPSLPFAVML